MRGVIEGFYGQPWSWGERALVARWCAVRGMPTFVWAPKSDPLHKAAWRDAWTAGHLEGFARLGAEPGVEVGVALAPGHVDGASAADRTALAAKVEPLLGAGVGLLVLAFDDLRPRPGMAEAQASLTAWLDGWLRGRARLALVPTEYVGHHPSPYLRALARGLPADVPIGWTGPAVVNDTITVADADRRADALGGRRPLLWDNWPVNDWVLADRLPLGPLRGREPGLAEACSGYLANPMRQPRCSLLPLASTAGWLVGEDPSQVWGVEADALGLRVLAEACDGVVPSTLVDALLDGGGAGWAGPAGRLASWLLAVASCDAPGLEGEADPWVAQARAEAGVGLAALRLYAATRPAVVVAPDGVGRAELWTDAALLEATMQVMQRWPAVRRAEATVFGPRCSFRPVLGQRPDGAWEYRRASLQEDANALDALVRLALDEAAAAGAPGPLSVEADREPLALERDGSFRAPPGAVVVARCGRTETQAPVGPGPWPVPDGRLG